jgi:hypothetical protein
MSVKTLSEALEALIGDEIAGKSRLEQELERQEKALVSGRPDDIDAATHAVEIELAREFDRARRREAIFARLASSWNVSAGALTLASIAERLGAGGEKLDAMRGELRASIARVLRRNRRVARLVHVQRGIVNDTVTALLGVGASDREPGALFEVRG